MLFFPQKSFAQKPCLDARNPVIFVHGFLASGDTWATQVQRFRANGYCANRLFVFDWNTVGGNRANADSLLNVFVDSVLKATGSQKADLVGHSAGGGLCYAYLSNESHSAKVAHYAHVGSGKIKGPAGYNGNVPTMIISSEGDKVTRAIPDVVDVVNVHQQEADHLEVATCDETFRSLYSFFNNDKLPLTISVSKQRVGKISLSGRAVVLGENAPVAQSNIFVYSFDPATGKRKTKTPLQALVSNDAGYWGPVYADAGEYIEFEVHPVEGRVISYFTEPQPADNGHMYLRCLPSKGFTALMFNKLPVGDDVSALAIFSANRAVVHGRDTMAINDIPLSSAVLTPASRTTIASFLFDDGDDVSSGTLMKLFGTGIFLNGIDLKIEAGESKKAGLFFNGRSMAIPCRPAKEAVMVAVFN